MGQLFPTATVRGKKVATLCFFSWHCDDCVFVGRCLLGAGGLRILVWVAVQQAARQLGRAHGEVGSPVEV